MVEIINQQKKHKLRIGHFRHLLDNLLSFYRIPEATLSLVFCGNRAMRRLNRRFRKKDRPTDVLSFPLREKAFDGSYYLGDIIISVPKAFSQCGRIEAKLEKELDWLTIHGFLHLLGYDHGQGMKEEEARVRSFLGLK